MQAVSRRVFLAAAAAAPFQGSAPLGFPLVDFHAHLDDEVTLERAIAISREKKVRLGIVEHAGKRQNQDHGRLSSDADLERFVSQIQGKPVYGGIQAEGRDWMTCFSKAMVARLDYVLTDALTFPERNGTSVQLWRPGVEVKDASDFMGRYVDFHLKILDAEPIDILANPTFLPESLQAQYDTLWTEQRMRRIIDAAVAHGVAIEINSRYRVPSLRFLRMAKEAGARFSFGSNIHGPGIGMLDYCVETARQLGLRAADMFTPAAPGRKPIERRGVPRG